MQFRVTHLPLAGRSTHKKLALTFSLSPRASTGCTENLFDPHVTAYSVVMYVLTMAGNRQNKLLNLVHESHGKAANKLCNQMPVVR
jgi:hypothetical protein